jgi:hypothetical protein
MCLQKSRLKKETDTICEAYTPRQVYHNTTSNPIICILGCVDLIYIVHQKRSVHQSRSNSEFLEWITNLSAGIYTHAIGEARYLSLLHHPLIRPSDRKALSEQSSYKEVSQYEMQMTSEFSTSILSGYCYHRICTCAKPFTRYQSCITIGSSCHCHLDKYFPRFSVG